MATQKDIQVCINPHFDAVALWIGSFGGEDLPCDISRGVFGAKRGVPRLIEFFKRYGITTTWGVTGHSMESFPRAAEMIIKAGHEIGIHGYTHENPLAMSREQEAEVLDRTYRSHQEDERQSAGRIHGAVVGAEPATPSSCCWRAG